MPRSIMIEEFHATMMAAAGSPEAQYRSMRRRLANKRFQRRLQRTIQQLLDGDRSLKVLRAIVSW